MGVGISACTMILLVALVSPALVTGQRAALLTVAGGVVFAVPAMLGGRYVLFAVRQRSRKPASEAVDVIVFGAGDAGSMLIRRLTHELDSVYRPVAILDDDPAKRRLRIQGIPVLGDRTQHGQGRREDRGHRSGHRDRPGQRQRDPGPYRRGGAVRPDAESGALRHRVAQRQCAHRRSARPADQRPARPQAGADGRHRGRPSLRGQAHPGDRGGWIDRLGVVPSAVPVPPGRADHARSGRVRAARDTAGPARPRAAGLRRDGRWPTSGIRIGSARYSSDSARRSSSTPPRSSISRCWSATRRRR